MLRCFDDGAIACDVRHRAQRVDFLRARDTRHAVHRHDGRAALRQFFQEFGVLCRPDKADQRLSCTQAFRLCVVRGANFHDQVGLRPERIRRVDHLTAGIAIRAIGETGFLAGASFDGHVETELDQLGRYLRRRRNTTFAFVDLFGYTDSHRNPSNWTAAV